MTEEDRDVLVGRIDERLKTVEKKTDSIVKYNQAIVANLLVLLAIILEHIL